MSGALFTRQKVPAPHAMLSCEAAVRGWRTFAAPTRASSLLQHNRRSGRKADICQSTKVRTALDSQGRERWLKDSRAEIFCATAEVYIPSNRGSHRVISGMYVISIRKVSMVKSQGQVARVTSVRPSRDSDEAT